jgi:hypothetical protein
MMVFATDRVQIQNMRQVQQLAWPHWTAMRTNTHEFVDPEGDRGVRVFCVERLEPGEVTQMASDYVPPHRNSYDVLFVTLQLPLSDTGVDAAEPIGGSFTYRPECLWTEGGKSFPASPPVSDHIQVNVYLHTNGHSGQPMITLGQVSEVLEELEREHPGSVQRARGEYLAPDGSVRETLEVCWERVMGYAFPYPAPQPLSFPMNFSVTAFPWHRSLNEPGVRYKPLVRINALGPVVKLVHLGEGAVLGAIPIDNYRFLSVLAGRVSYGQESLSDLTVLFGSPGAQLQQIVAEEPTLLWVIDWQAAGHPWLSTWAQPSSPV